MKTKFLWGALLLMFLPLGAMGQAESPLGEKANYELDKSADRTSNFIRSGTLVTSVVSYDEDRQGEPAFQVNIDYDLNVFPGGKQKGSQKTFIPESFFTGDFFVRLRKEKVIVTDSFTIEHVGYGDAVLKSGVTYPNCDRVIIRDIKAELAPGLIRFIDGALGMDPNMAPTSDQELHGYIHTEIPAIGAAKLDLQGSQFGIKMKAGFDFVE